MTATWKKDGEEWGKQSQKRSKRPHKSERRKALLQEIPFATAGRTSSVTRERTLVHIGATVTHVRTHATHHGGRPVNHCVKWQHVAYTGRAHDGMSREYKAVAKFTKTLFTDAASLAVVAV